jgi:hypothetical protein
MVSALVSLVITLAVLALIHWALTQFPIPEPFGRILRVVVIFVAVLVVIYFLLGLIDGGSPRLLLRD